jgi:hypothetical protein
MSIKELLTGTRKKWKALICLKIMLMSLLSGLYIILAGFYLQLNPWISVLMTVICTILFAFILSKQFPSNDQLIQLINHQLPKLEFSTRLLFESNLNRIEQLQKKQLQEIELPAKNLTLPVSWRHEIGLTALLFAGLLPQLIMMHQESDIENNQRIFYAEPVIESPVKDSVYLTETSVRIVPPKYTQISSYETYETALTFPAASELHFNLKFNGNPSEVWINPSFGKEIILNEQDNQWKNHWVPEQSGFYQYVFKRGEQLEQTPLYSLYLIQDQKPEVNISGIPTFQRLTYQENLDFSFEVDMRDDYGLQDGYVVATITKGSGESVKFREQKFAFDEPVLGKATKRSITLNASALDLEPGNELYFYAIAFDNKEPAAQSQKTTTHFVILEDTSEVAFSLQGNLGVDIMPDYFRSQLQIIIDTKELIANKEILERHQFNEKSNALGFDQKQLRLKYGQFIGEEEDSGLEIEQEEPLTGDNQSVDILEEFGHDTDHENEEGQLMDKGTYQDEHEHEPGHDHGHEEDLNPDTDEDPLAAYLHNHEDEETATFFTQTLKAKLRAALNQMWDAELYLRLYRPKESLPYQEAALELLNEIKNHARIYVQRVGFDPPPIKEMDSRLTREVEDPNDQPFASDFSNHSPTHKILILLTKMSNVVVEGPQPNKLTHYFEDAGKELAAIAIDQPGEYLKELNIINILSGKEKFMDEDILVMHHLVESLGRLVNNNSLPGSRFSTQNDLNNKLMELTQQ